MDKDRSKVIAFSKRYKHAVVDTNYTDVMDLLNANSYQKGGWVLHMLRYELGDSLFQQSIRTYYQKCRLSNADTKDFEQVVETVAKRKLDWFFKQWLYNGGHPLLKIDSEIDKENLTLTIEQKNKLFLFPLNIEIEFKDGKKRIEQIEVFKNVTTITRTYPKEIQRITIDPKVDLLYEKVK